MLDSFIPAGVGLQCIAKHLDVNTPHSASGDADDQPFEGRFRQVRRYNCRLRHGTAMY
jgi:hypothetical protein